MSSTAFVPPGSRLVLAGRDVPPLPVARLRVTGRMLEIGPGDLALAHEEATALLRNAGLSVGEDDVAELHRRTEGWPAGLYLAALGLRDGGPVAGPADAFRGDEWLVRNYMESEFLAWLSPRQREFPTRTAVLDRLCGPLCEAVLDQPGAAATLAYLARSNLLVPLDRQREWYRFHQLFRDLLLAELRHLEPELILVGLELTGPGVTEADTWRAWMPGPVLRSREGHVLAGVARKPWEMPGVAGLRSADQILGGARSVRNVRRSSRDGNGIRQGCGTIRVFCLPANDPLPEACSPPRYERRSGLCRSQVGLRCSPAGTAWAGQRGKSMATEQVLKVSIRRRMHPLTPWSLCWLSVAWTRLDVPSKLLISALLLAAG